MICSGGVGAATQKGQKTGPRSYRIPRKRLRGPMPSHLPNAELSLHRGCLYPCGETPVLNHTKVLGPRPPFCVRNLAMLPFPARMGAGSQACPDQGHWLPDCSRVQWGQECEPGTGCLSLGLTGHLMA